MIIVLGEVVVPAGAVERMRDALVTMQTETRKEAGCLAYAFSVEIGDATKVLISERWESMAALQAHFVSPHMAAFGAAVAAVQPTAMDVRAYEVAREIDLPRG